MIWHSIEIIIIITIILVQLYILVRQIFKINKFKELFEPEYVVWNSPETCKPQVHLWDAEKKDITAEHPMAEAVKSINTYLDHNYGSSVNFSIIEDIIAANTIRAVIHNIIRIVHYIFIYCSIQT